jgi:hypothetical protein
VGIKWKTKVDEIPQMTATTESLNGKRVKVGALKGEHAW